MRLLADGLDPLVLDDWETGIQVETFDPGYPNVRSVVTDRPGADGTFDETRYFGARAVSITAKIYDGTGGTRRQNLDRLASFCHPGRRPVMEWEDPTGGGLRSITLRADQASAPLTNPAITDVSVTWVAPSGVIKSAVTKWTWILPAVLAPGTGFDWTFDLEFPFHTGGPVMVLNEGSVPAEWQVAFFGPMTGPTLTNRNSEASISFPGLTIAAGDFLLVDSASRTALLNGSPTASRYDSYGFATSAWWQLGVGATLLDLTVESSASPATALFVHNDTFLF